MPPAAIQIMDNCFIILGLSFDPAENDENKINEAINKKVQKWQNESKNPRKTVMAKEKLEMVPEIKRIMGNPELRANEAQKAKMVIKDKLKEADLEIRLKLSGGKITEDEIKKLADKYKDFGITEKQLRLLIPGETDRCQEPKLPPNITSQIETYFDNLDMDDMSLYEFLQSHQDMSMEAMLGIAEKRLQFLLQKGEKTSSDEMEQKIAGIAKQIFSSSELYNGYNYYLKGHRYRKINQLLESGAKSNNGNVNAEMFKVLFELCDETYKMSPSQYTDYMKAACSYDGYILEKCSLENQQIPTPARPVPPSSSAGHSQYSETDQKKDDKPDIIIKIEERLNKINSHIKQLGENMDENSKKFAQNIPNPTLLTVYIGAIVVFLLVNAFFLIQFHKSISPFLENIIYFITIALIADGAYNGYILYNLSMYTRSARSFFVASSMFNEIIKTGFTTLPFSMNEVTKMTAEAASHLNSVIEGSEAYYSICFSQYNRNIKYLKKFIKPPKYGYLIIPRIILVETLFFTFYYVLLKYFPHLL